MKQILMWMVEGYTKMFGGLIGLIVCIPGIALFVMLLAILVKQLVNLWNWSWSLFA